MKLASLKHGRDGRLVVVSDDLRHYAEAIDIAPTMQAALEDWDNVLPRLRARAQELAGGKGALALDAAKLAAPLPRAYQIVDGSAYLNHVELVRKARGAEMPPEFRHDPLMYQAVSDTILSPTDPIPVVSEEYGIDYEAEVAVITGDVPMGVTPEEAGDYIRLVMLMNDVSLRDLIPNELGKGFGFLNAKPPSAFSPVAVTPDALGAHWDGGRLHRPLLSFLNGREMGRPDAGADMQFDFRQLIAHAAKTRPLGAGTIVGSGTVSNYDRAAGVSCMAEIRMIEKIDEGAVKTPFLKFGDVVRIEMHDEAGASIFGTIEQTVTAYQKPGQNACAVPPRKAAP